MSKLLQTGVAECPKCDASMDLYIEDGVTFRMCCNCEHKEGIEKAIAHKHLTQYTPFCNVSGCGAVETIHGKGTMEIYSAFTSKGWRHSAVLGVRCPECAAKEDGQRKTNWIEINKLHKDLWCNVCNEHRGGVVYYEMRFNMSSMTQVIRLCAACIEDLKGALATNAYWESVYSNWLDTEDGS